MGQSPPSSGPVKGSMPVPMLQLVEDMGIITEESSMGSTRLVLVTVLASKLRHTEATLMESVKLVLLILPASMQLVMVHQLIRVSRTVCVTHVPVHLMTQVSLTSVVTNWTLENCWTSSRISSSPRLATKTIVLLIKPSAALLGHWLEEGLMFLKRR